MGTDGKNLIEEDLGADEPEVELTPDEKAFQALIEKIEPENLEPLSKISAKMRERLVERLGDVRDFPERPTNHFLQQRFGNGVIMPQARIGYDAFYQSLVIAKEGGDFEAALTERINRMSLEDIRAIPDQMRLTMLQVLNGNAAIDNDITKLSAVDQALWKTRARLTFGDDFENLKNLNRLTDYDGRNSVMYSQRFDNWLTEKNNDYERAEREFFETHPEEKAIVDRWKADPASVTQDQKMQVLENLHNLHSAVFGYTPVTLIASKTMKDLEAAYVEMQAKEDDPGQWRRFMTVSQEQLDQENYKNEPGESYNHVRQLLLHESDHAAQSSWYRHQDDFAANDPRRELFDRMAAHSIQVGLFDPPDPTKWGHGTLWSIEYLNDPRELAAYMKHAAEEGPTAAPSADVEPGYKPRYLPNGAP